MGVENYRGVLEKGVGTWRDKKSFFPLYKVGARPPLPHSQQAQGELNESMQYCSSKEQVKVG